MFLKNHIQKDVTPSIPWSGQFIEHGGDNILKNMLWIMETCGLDYTMEQVQLIVIYVDGVKLDLPTSIS